MRWPFFPVGLLLTFVGITFLFGVYYANKGLNDPYDRSALPIGYILIITSIMFGIVGIGRAANLGDKHDHDIKVNEIKTALQTKYGIDVSSVDLSHKKIYYHDTKQRYCIATYVKDYDWVLVKETSQCTEN